MKNYLFNLYPNYPLDFDLENRKDPDSSSKELYDDLRTTFFSSDSKLDLNIRSIQNKVQGNKEKYYTLFVNGDEHLLSADYIGPSVHWAKKANLNDTEIIKFLSYSRTLGGHIVFPRGAGSNVIHWHKQKRLTINTARGGQDGYFDRFDLTLFAIKNLFEGNKISNEKMEKAWINYSDWFERFNGSFIFFIDFFHLNDFVNKDYDILDLTSFNPSKKKYSILKSDSPWIPETREEYMRYVEGTNHAIKARTKKLQI